MFLYSCTLNGFGRLCGICGICIGLVDADYKPVDPKPPAPLAVGSPNSVSFSTM